ncbi:restriction endonuclease subunit S [Microcoleus sp. B5-D4]|uniref:restriction endonuclease subunit S n=1 Tax=unclassified Microcoleus TaxID=2642155 RepID=UPI002FD39B8F
MDLKTFLENFDVIAEAPGGIPKLRSLILDLAMRGKLVPQSLEDEPASKLLTRIKNEFKELINQKKIRKAELLPVLKDDEVPFDKPIGWEWCRLGEIVRVSSGDNLTSHNMADSGKIPVFGGNGVTGYHDKANVHKPTLVIGRVGFYCGSVHITPKLAWVTDNAFITTFSENCIYIHFVYWLLKAINLQQNNSATAQPVISGGKIYSIPVPLPPLAEQKQIVEKVEELMALCDRYEATKQTRDNLRQKLRGSAIASLMNSETDEELDAAWAFVRDNWQNLSQHSGDVSSLRQSILNLAIRGNLVCQQSEDEPAHKIFKEIQESKQLLYSNKKATKKKECLPFNDKEIPFSIPKTWKWVRLHELCWLISDGTHHTPTYVESGVPFLSVKNVSGGCLDFSNTRFITRESHEELCVRCKPEYGDILLTKVGTTGIAVEIDTHQEFSIFVSIALLKHFPEFTYPRFLQYLLNSSFVKAQSEAGTEGVGNKNLVLRKIYNFIVPLPPLAEQKRIVAKVDELMQLCDQLEASLRQSQQRAESLAASAISHLTI